MTAGEQAAPGAASTGAGSGVGVGVGVGAGASRAKRVDIISDTHGYLSPELLVQLRGADLIIHAGDITSESDWEYLKTVAPIKAVVGNNDYLGEYGPEVPGLNRFAFEGLQFAVAHYREDLPVGSVDVAVCGHTHRAKIVHLGRCTVVNPGSASYPRGTKIPSMARMYVSAGEILSLEIVQL